MVQRRQSGMESGEADATPSHLDRLVRSHGDINTSQHFTIKGEKGGTDLCCHWQPKSSKGRRRRENAFCPSEGGEVKRRRRGGKEVGRGTRRGGEGHTVHASITDQRWKKNLEERHKHVYQMMREPVFLPTLHLSK